MKTQTTKQAIAGRVVSVRFSELSARDQRRRSTLLVGIAEDLGLRGQVGLQSQAPRKIVPFPRSLAPAALREARLSAASMSAPSNRPLS